MKTLISAIAILCAVILTTVFVAIYTDKLLEDFGEKIDAAIPEDNCQKAYEGTLEIEKEYDRIKSYFVLFMRENDLRETEIYIKDIKSAATSDDLPGIAAAKNRLLLHLEQLRRLSVFSMEAIF